MRLARRKDRYVFSSVVAHASAVNEDRRSLAFRIWRRNADVGREGAGPYGCFDLWLRVNGADVANSNVQLCQDEGSRAKDVIISQGIVPMEAGDTLEVLMSANHPEAAMCIEAIQPSGEPLEPSIIFSMIK